MKRKSIKITKYLIISATALLVFGLTVAFALFTTELTISGQLIKEEASWKIGFTNVSAPVLTGSAKSYRSEIMTDGTTIIVHAALTEPGDSVTYTFDVSNQGNIDAKILSYSLGNLNSTSADINNYNIEGKLTYSDGTAVSQNDKLGKGETKGLKLYFEYKGEEALTEDDVYFSINVKINYVQD